MALHGTISINLLTIGWWEAVRQETLLSDDQVSTYRWAAELNGEQRTGVLTHRYSDGAVALAAAVLTAYLEEDRAVAMAEVDQVRAVASPKRKKAE